MLLFDHLMLGATTIFSWEHLLYCFIGVSLGTLVGVLPGLGPVATISLLLPLTYSLTPETALIMLAGIYYGAQYGGSTAAILVNLPGESSAVVTCLDGHAMARNGRAGAALGIAAIGSFIAGSLAILVVAAAAAPLASLALRFGPADYFSLMVLGLVAAIVMAHGSLIKALGMTLVGIQFGFVGIDPLSGIARYTLGQTELGDGISFVALAMGLFGIAEIIQNIQSPESRKVTGKRIGSLLPNRQERQEAWRPILRGTALGSALGMLPGSGATLSSFCAYAVEKKLSRTPDQFGQGAVAGLAGPESANNAGAQTAFIPLLVLGLPSNAVMALMVGAMMIHGIIPGPQVMEQNASLFWGLIVSMWLGNLLLLMLNLPLIGLWVRLLSVPYRILVPAILMFCCIGIYSVRQSPFDILTAVVFGILGYLFLRLRCEAAPLILGFILGPMLEENFNRAMLLSRGTPSTFLDHPMSLSFIIASAVLLSILLLPGWSRRRDVAFS